MEKENREATAIIICAGEGTRWGNYLNVPKHLIELEGERLIDRTVRLLKERNIENIYIVTKEFDPRYFVEGAKQVPADLKPELYADADKFLSSRSCWNHEEGRTIVLYGDCYFTDAAMDTIVNFEKREWTLFCRTTQSSITGTPWGECFAQSFYPEHIEKHEEMLKYVGKLHRDKVIKRCGGWEHYGAMMGRRGSGVLQSHKKMTTNYVEINDFTDDFDYPGDLDSWKMKRAKFLSRK